MSPLEKSVFLIFFFLSIGCYSQTEPKARPNPTVIKQLLAKADSDTAKIRLLISLSEAVDPNNLDTVEAISLSIKKLINQVCKSEKMLGDPFVIKAKLQNLQIYGYVCQKRNKSEEGEKAYIEVIESVKPYVSMEKLADLYRNFGYFFRSLSLYQKAKERYQKMLVIYQSVNNKQKEGEAYSTIADMDFSLGNVKEAEAGFLKGIEIRKSVNDEKGVSTSYNNLGNLYYSQGNINDAVACFYKAITIKDKIKDYKGWAQTMINLSDIFLKQGDTLQALENLNKVEALSKQKDLKVAMGSVNIYKGFICHGKQKQDSALYYYKESLKIRKAIPDNTGMAYCHYNMARAYASTNEKELAKAHMDSATVIWEQSGDKKGIARSFATLGEDYLKKNDFDNAGIYALKSYTLAKEIQNLSQINESAKLLSVIYKKKQAYEKALEMYEMYVSAKDSLNSDENRNVIFKSKAAYEFQLKEANLKAIQDQKTLAFEEKIKRDNLLFQFEKKSQEQKSESEKQTLLYEEKLKQEKIQNDFKVKEEQSKQEQAKKDILFKEQKKQQNIILFTVVAILLTVLGFSTLLYNRFKITKKQNKIIAEQKNQVEEKNKEITDSITYAKRIQSAILPPERIVKQHLPGSFIFYQPKDIVAGDFYWLEVVEDWTIFAAADCTGHGVPGAMVSVVCHNALNRSVKEFGLHDPGAILDKTREIIISEFEKSDEEVKDGMDISLCAIDKKRSVLKWAGANNPLWIVRENGILEIKANKQPIGKYADQQSFTTHTIRLEPNDNIYIFTDGYQDQFGGEKGKKFKASKLKELLINITPNAPEKQMRIIAENFTAWKMNLEQVDDVCIIGVKI